jgi:hypothetical protein
MTMVDLSSAGRRLYTVSGRRDTAAYEWELIIAFSSSGAMAASYRHCQQIETSQAIYQQRCSVDRLSFRKAARSPTFLCGTRAQHKTRISLSIASEEEATVITTETQPTPKKSSLLRAGGRVANHHVGFECRPSAGDGGSIVLSLGRLAVPQLCSELFLQMLFGGISGLLSWFLRFFYQAACLRAGFILPGRKG